jgi:hypothetical protein
MSAPSRTPARPRVRSLLFFALGAALLAPLLLGACGGAAGTSQEDPFVVPTPPEGGGGGTTTPPPEPPQTPVWTPNAAAYGRVALFGSFPSALVRFGDTLLATDADQVEGTGARILAFDVSGPAPVPSATWATTPIPASSLVDSSGRGGDASNPIGYGFYLDDLLVVDEHLAFVLVNAAGSDVVPTLSDVVAFDPSAGTIRQVYDLTARVDLPGRRTDSSGASLPVGGYAQSGAEALAWRPLSATDGLLYVAMSNLVFGAPSYGAVKYPGTVQVLHVARQSPTPLAPALLGSGQPFVFGTQAYNPVALDLVHVPVLAGNPPRTRLLVTLAGTTATTPGGALLPVTAAAVEAYDGDDGTQQGRFDLGLVGLAAVRPALGQDAAGHRVGFYPSAVTGEIYLLRLDGLYTQVLDPSALAVLRGPANGIPITAAQAGGPGGNVTSVALAPDGRTLAATGFGDLFQSPPVPGQLFLLALPADLVTGAGFGADFVPGSTRFAAASGRTLGSIVLVPNPGNRPDVFVNVSGTLDANFLGQGGASLGSLQTFGLIR